MARKTKAERNGKQYSGVCAATLGSCRRASCAAPLTYNLRSPFISPCTRPPRRDTPPWPGMRNRYYVDEGVII